MLNTNLPWKLTNNRYAVLGVPRSGTQLLEAFVKYSLTKKHSNVADLQEIFTVQACLVNSLHLRDGLLSIEQAEPVKFENMLNVSKSRLDLLKQASPDQALTCRVFLDNRMSSLSFVDGITLLKDLGFEFIYIKRSFEHKILSGVFAKESFIFNRTKNNMRLTVDIPELKSFIIARYLLETHHLALMESLIEYHTVDYDTLVSKADLLDDAEREQAFGIFREKQLSLDPYDQIENADEVRQVFAEFYPKLQALATSLQ